MCTVTLLRTPGALMATMNRDERLSRAPEEAPSVQGVGPMAWIGPRDGEAGGTWIGVSEAAVVGCLLNGYAPGEEERPLPPGIRSRGWILPEVLARAPAAGRRWLREEFDPEQFRSFHLVVADPEGAESFTWIPGRGLRGQPLPGGWSMLTSSSALGEPVLEWRQQQFSAWVSRGSPVDGKLPSFHLLTDAGREGWSPLMTRAQAATRSISQVRCDLARRRAEFLYWRRQPGTAVDPQRPDAQLGMRLRPSGQVPSQVHP